MIWIVLKLLHILLTMVPVNIIDKASTEFIERYSNWLPLGNIFEWYLKRDVRLWLDNICYYSFVNSSVGGNCSGMCFHLCELFGYFLSSCVELIAFVLIVLAIVRYWFVVDIVRFRQNVPTVNFIFILVQIFLFSVSFPVALLRFFD